MTVLNQRKRISAEDNTIVKNIEMTLAENNDIVLKFYKQNYIDELSEEEISTFNISLGEYYKKSYIDDSFYTKSELDTKFDSLVGFTVSIVSELPSTGENGVMYLVPSADGETGNTYIEYIWVDNKFEKIGDTTTKVNLTDYYTKAQVDTQISTQIQNYHLGPFRDELTNKADKIHTHEDATISKSGFMSASDKSKLDSLNESGDITIDTSLSLTSGNPVSNRVITQALNGKASTDVVSTSLNGLMSKDDKIKLDGIAEGANKTIVDSSLSSTSTNPVQNKVVNSALNGKANINHNHNSTYSLLDHQHTGLDGKVDIICRSAGEQSTAGYRKAFRLQITNQYFDSPVSFEFVQRKSRQTARVHIIFNSVTSTDPSLRAFTYDGAIEQPIYLYKESASTWVFIFKEQSNYDTVNIRFLPLSSSIKDNCIIIPLNEYLTDLPTDNIQVGSMISATSTRTGYMDREDKIKLDGIDDGANKTIVDSSLSSTSVNPVQGKIISSALSEKANVSHTHSIGDIDNLQSALNDKAKVQHNHTFATIVNLQSALNGKANTSHTHNDTYYTKDEINTRLGDIETILNEILGV